jgi:hypothetical protein
MFAAVMGLHGWLHVRKQAVLDEKSDGSINGDDDNRTHLLGHRSPDDERLVDKLGKENIGGGGGGGGKKSTTVQRAGGAAVKPAGSTRRNEGPPSTVSVTPQGSQVKRQQPPQQQAQQQPAYVLQRASAGKNTFTDLLLKMEAFKNLALFCVNCGEKLKSAREVSETWTNSLGFLAYCPLLLCGELRRETRH